MGLRGPLLVILAAAALAGAACQGNPPAAASPAPAAKASPKATRSPGATGSAKPGGTPTPGTDATSSPAPSASPTPVPAATGTPAPKGPALAPGTTTGAVHGRVFAVEDKARGVGGVGVSVGEFTTTSADPKADAVVAEDAANAAKDGISVMHVFEPGGAPTLALRRNRVQPPSASEADRYLYLRPGEYFLEGLAPGTRSLDFKVGELKFTTSVAVAAGEVVVGFDFGAAGTGSDAVGELAMDAMTPKVLKATVKDDAVSYLPDPPAIVVTFKVMGGAAPHVISAFDVTYIYGTDLRTTSPVRIQAPTPVSIPAGPLGTWGLPVDVTIPVGSPVLTALLKADKPSIVYARAQVVDGQGHLNTRLVAQVDIVVN